MTTIHSNKAKTKFFYINSKVLSVVTIEFIDKGARIATVRGEKARIAMLELKHNIKYNRSEYDLLNCNTFDFADALDKAQKLIIKSLDNINILQTA
jgi:hypothetical protein